MKEGFFNKVREYLLTFDENIRERIRKSIEEDDFEFISKIENSFLSDKHINAIIQEFQLERIQEEIKDLHAEYYLQLAELYAEGKTNKEIETLLSSDNQTFKKTVLLFPDEATFFKELSIAVDDKKTEQLKKGYAEIDEWLESKKSSRNNDEARVVSIRRKIFRYAIAAAVVGLLIGGAYFKFFSYKQKNKNTLSHNDSLNKPPFANLDLPNHIEIYESKISIIVDKQDIEIAESDNLKDSIYLKTNGFLYQIKYLEEMQIATSKHLNHQKVNDDSNVSINYLLWKSRIISNQIDSLLNLLNTYTYNFQTKKMVLNFPNVSIVKKIISTNPNNLSELYIKIEDKYYLIKNSEVPLKLFPIKDEKEIEILTRIELLNYPIYYR